MNRVKTKKGETIRRVYAILHRNSGMTSMEVAALMPDLTIIAVQCALHKMKMQGAVEVRGKRQLLNPKGRNASYDVYHVKYKSGAIHKPKGKSVPEAKIAPPMTASEAAKLIAHNKYLSQLLKDALEDVAEKEKQLEAAMRRRLNWWDAVKEWFA